MQRIGLFFALLLVMAAGAGAQDADAIDHSVERRWQSRFFGGSADVELSRDGGDIRHAGTIRLKLPAMRRGQAVGVWRDVLAFEASTSSADGAACRLDALGELLAESTDPERALVEDETLEISGTFSCRYDLAELVQVELRGAWTLSGSVRLEADAETGIVDVEIDLHGLATVAARATLSLADGPVPMESELSASELELCHVALDSRVGGEDEHADLEFAFMDKQHVVLRVGDGEHEDVLASFQAPEEQIGLLDVTEFEPSLPGALPLASPHEIELPAVQGDDRAQDVAEQLGGLGAPDPGAIEGPGGADPLDPFAKETPSSEDETSAEIAAELSEERGSKRGPGEPGSDGTIDLGQGPAGSAGELPSPEDDPRGDEPSSVLDEYTATADLVAPTGPGGADPRLTFESVAEFFGEVISQGASGNGPYANGVNWEDGDIGARIAEMIIEELGDSANEFQREVIRQQFGSTEGMDLEEEEKPTGTGGGSGGILDTIVKAIRAFFDWLFGTPNPDGIAAPKMTAAEIFLLKQKIVKMVRASLIDPGPDAMTKVEIDFDTLQSMRDLDTIFETRLSPYITPHPDVDNGGDDDSEEEAGDALESLIQPTDPEGEHGLPGVKPGREPPPDGGGGPLDD